MPPRGARNWNARDLFARNNRRVRKGISVGVKDSMRDDDIRRQNQAIQRGLEEAKKREQEAARERAALKAERERMAEERRKRSRERRAQQQEERAQRKEKIEKDERERKAKEREAAELQGQAELERWRKEDLPRWQKGQDLDLEKKRLAVREQEQKQRQALGELLPYVAPASEAAGLLTTDPSARGGKTALPPFMTGMVTDPFTQDPMYGAEFARGVEKRQRAGLEARHVESRILENKWKAARTKQMFEKAKAEAANAAAPGHTAADREKTMQHLLDGRTGGPYGGKAMGEMVPVTLASLTAKMEAENASDIERSRAMREYMQAVQMIAESGGEIDEGQAIRYEYKSKRPGGSLESDFAEMRDHLDKVEGKTPIRPRATYQQPTAPAPAPQVPPRTPDSKGPDPKAMTWVRDMVEELQKNDDPAAKQAIADRLMKRGFNERGEPIR